MHPHHRSKQDRLSSSPRPPNPPLPAPACTWPDPTLLRPHRPRLRTILGCTRTTKKIQLMRGGTVRSGKKTYQISSTHTDVLACCVLSVLSLLLSLVLCLLLVHTCLLPYGECFGRYGCEVASEFMALQKGSRRGHACENPENKAQLRGQ
jgi:hypothetical protein